MANIRILLADDHKIIRDGLKMIIDKFPGIDVVAEAENGKMALEICEKEQIDLIVMDINMPEMDGIEATRHVREKHPEIKVLPLTMSDNDVHIRNMIEAGASGYILKSSGSNDLRSAIEMIMDGKHFFSDESTQAVLLDLIQNRGKPRQHDPINITEREMEVLELIIKEFTNPEIAKKLFISSRTVDAHRRNLLQKTGARNTAGLVRYAMEKKLFD